MTTTDMVDLLLTSSSYYFLQKSMGLTVILTLVSIALHGFLPSVFTLAVVNSGMSIMNLSVWSIIQIHSTLRVLASSVRAWWHWGLIPILSYITYLSPYHGCSLIAFLLFSVWAIKVYRKIHVAVDPFVVCLVSFILVVAIAKAVKCGDILDVYNVGLNTTGPGGEGRLEISSPIADVSLHLRPKAADIKVVNG